jgi:DNA-binding transcriptional ArsR family regulator
MSRKIPSSRLAQRRSHAPVFAALGDRTRLALVAKLSHGELHSISELTQGSRLTRQAITKHLHVLERAGMVRCMRRGRESLFAFNPEPLYEAKSYLESVSEQWDQALTRLKMLVEEDAPN